MSESLFNAYHIDGVLHLGALAIALTLGYIGLDREIRGSLDRLGPTIEQIRLSLFKTMQTADLIPPGENNYNTHIINFEDDSTAVFPRYWVYLACILTGYPSVASKRRRLAYFLIRQRHIPLYVYFKKVFDFYAAALFCILCLVTFIPIAATSVWQMDFAEIHLLIKFAFITYATTLVWLLAGLLFLARLVSSVGKIGERCVREISHRYQLVLNHNKREALSDLDNIP